MTEGKNKDKGGDDGLTGCLLGTGVILLLVLACLVAFGLLVFVSSWAWHQGSP